MAIVSRFFEPPTGSFFLFGPRGTGKTTFIRERFPDATIVNLLQPDLYRELSARPERLRERVEGRSGTDVVIDEVQRVPELLHVVHDLMESPARVRFILTGSSARKLRRGGVDLLGGRAVVRTMHPFMAAELPEFSLERALETGLVPLIVSAADRLDSLRAYATVYLEQEVRAEGIVRNIGSFARFLEVATFSHGAVLNVANVARETAIKRKTVEGYLEVAEDLLLTFRVPVFSKRAQRAVVVHPKFYFFDAGIFRSLRPRGPLDRPQEIDGAALEGLVAQHLRAWIAYSGQAFDLGYWRTRAGTEVDFVVYGESGFWAIEVKNSRAVHSQDVRALRTFVSEYPECTPIMLYRGKDPMVIEGIRVLPVAEFLRRLRPGVPLSS